MTISDTEDPALSATRPRRERRGEHPRIVPDRRRHKRVPVTLSGRFMTEDKQEHFCEVVNMSPGGMALRAAVSAEPGERIVAYLDNFGRLEGTVARTFDGGFAIEINASAQKRERIANLLTWYSNRDYLGGEERQHDRFEPRLTAQKLMLPNGDVHDCRVIDVSMSGASLAARVKPPLDSVVMLGRLRGKVVRHHDQGFGVQFAELQDPDSLARTFG